MKVGLMGLNQKFFLGMLRRLKMSNKRMGRKKKGEK